MGIRLAAGDARVVLDPAQGARATSWQVAGTELLGHAHDEGASTPVGHGMYVMAPWAGRLRDSTLRHGGAEHPMPVDGTGWALHGTVLARTWTVDEVHADRAVLSVPLTAPWPWAGTVRATWELAPDRLVTTLTVESDGDVFPASVGWHPWFRRRLTGAHGEEVRVEVPGDRMLERGADHLPTGRELAPRPPGPYDDAFPLDSGSVPTITWPGELQLRCRTDCGYVVVFDEQRTAVCLEPQTAPPDGPNTAPDLVCPGRPLVASATWSWTSAEPDRGLDS